MQLCAVKRCEHGKVWCFWRVSCPGGSFVVIDFDAIWTRYYASANRRFESGLTYNELWYVIYGEEKDT